MARKKQTERPVATVRLATGDEDARVWLRANGYADIADQIDAVMIRWKAEGNRTRRNWWEILAGHVDGQPRIAGGISFPVLRAARIRQGLADVPNAISRNPNEEPPPVRVSPRWSKKRRRRSHRRRV